jgi:hypothetical protein
VAWDVVRAPRWLQRLGLEWVHRLVQEPRRLFRRYLVEGVPFAVRLLAYALLHRVLSRLALRPDRIQPRHRQHLLVDGTLPPMPRQWSLLPVLTDPRTDG